MKGTSQILVQRELYVTIMQDRQGMLSIQHHYVHVRLRSVASISVQVTHFNAGQLPGACLARQSTQLQISQVRHALDGALAVLVRSNIGHLITFCDLADGSFTRLTIPLALSLALCNMDRIVLSIAMLAIAKEYGFSLAQQVRCLQDPVL